MEANNQEDSDLERSLQDSLEEYELQQALKLSKAAAEGRDSPAPDSAYGSAPDSSGRRRSQSRRRCSPRSSWYRSVQRRRLSNARRQRRLRRSRFSRARRHLAQELSRRPAEACTLSRALRS